jgi:hypothetical protein
MVSEAVAVSEKDTLKANEAETASEPVAVSEKDTLKANEAETASEPVAVSEKETLNVVPPGAAKIQPSEPLLVEFAPAYHVLSRL